MSKISNTIIILLLVHLTPSLCKMRSSVTCKMQYSSLRVNFWYSLVHSNVNFFHMNFILVDCDKMVFCNKFFLISLLFLNLRYYHYYWNMYRVVCSKKNSVTNGMRKFTGFQFMCMDICWQRVTLCDPETEICAQICQVCVDAMGDTIRKVFTQPRGKRRQGLTIKLVKGEIANQKVSIAGTMPTLL